jgi:hypothetical protein
MSDLEELEVVNDIQNLVTTCLVYLNLKDNPYNPFVKNIGQDLTEEQVLDVMRELANKLKFLSEDLTVSVENKDLI